MNLCLYLVDPLQILLPVRSSGTFVWVGTYSNLISCKTWSVRWQWGNHKVCPNLLIEDICKHMEVKHGGIVELCISHSWACINWLSSLRVVCVPEKERCRWWPGQWWWWRWWWQWWWWCRWWCRWWPGHWPLAIGQWPTTFWSWLLKFVRTNFWHLIFMSECVCLNSQSFKMEMEEIYMSTIVLSPKVVLCDPEVFF